jgi:hypothetical protein
MKHSLERTSPKGEGQNFIGTCIQCGKQNVTSKMFFDEECPNTRGLSEEESLLEAIEGPRKL